MGSVVLAVVGAATLILAISAIVTRQYRWGHRALQRYRGVSAVLRGIALLPIASAFGLAAYIEHAHPGSMASGDWMSGAPLRIAEVLFGLAMMFWGAAYVFDRASDERKAFAVTIPSRIAGAFLVIAGIGLALHGATAL